MTAQLPQWSVSTVSQKGAEAAAGCSNHNNQQGRTIEIS